MRKFISVLLVMVLVLSMASMAFAAPSPAPYVDQTGENVSQTTPDGTSVTTSETTAADGTKVTETTVTTPDGTTTKTDEVAVSNQAAAGATDGTVTVPVEVTASEDVHTAPTVKVTLPEGASNVEGIEIPVTNGDGNTVAYLVNADGSTTLIKDTLKTDKGIVIPASENPITIKVVDNDKAFNDENSVSDWAKEGVEFATSREIFVGDGQGNINPKDPMTVGAMATIVSRMAGAGLNDTGAEWYAEPMAWANAQGMNPDGSGYTQNVTRQQYAFMLYKLAGSPATTATLDSFGDKDSVTDTYAQALAWAVEKGLLRGDGTNLNPAGTATREELMTITERYYKTVA